MATNFATNQRTKEEAALARITSGLSTASKWDEDPELLKECRSLVPFSMLIPSNDASFLPMRNKYGRPDDGRYEGDDLFLKRLTLWFKLDFMTWVNRPQCFFCGCKEHMKANGARPAMTQEEKEGDASRVEGRVCGYYCLWSRIIKPVPFFTGCIAFYTRALL